MDAMINEELILSSRSLKTKETTNLKNLLNQIYHRNKHNCYTSIINDLTSIPSLFNLLIQSAEKEKIEVLDFLNKNINYNPNNCEIYTRISKNNTNINESLIMILVKLFLTENKKEILTLVREILEILINNVDISINVFEYLYQQLAEYYRKDMDLTNLKLMKFIDLLKILYGEKQIKFMPRNYFYFTGEGSISVSEKALEENKFKLTNGITITLWFRIEGFPTEESSNACSLIYIKGSKGNKIQISLNIDKMFISNLTHNDPIYKFQKGWNNLTFILKPNKILKDCEFVIIPTDGVLKSFKISQFDCDIEVLEMIFFKNFIGQASSIVVFNKAIKEDNLKVFKEFSHGIYSEKKLIKLLKYGNNNYLNNSNYDFKKNSLTNKFSESVNCILDSLKILYMPTRFNDKLIYDVIENYNAVFNSSPNKNNFHNFFFFQKNIFYLGGIRNILPIFEIICK